MAICDDTRYRRAYIDVMSFREIIKLWPSIASFSREMNVPYQRAFRWYHRNSIPARYWRQLIDVLEQHQVRMTFDELIKVAA
jgi:hypothetical protein